jgi:hypothetical protein
MLIILGILVLFGLAIVFGSQGRPRATLSPKRKRVLLGLLLLVEAIGLLYTLLAAWPAVDPSPGSVPTATASSSTSGTPDATSTPNPPSTPPSTLSAAPDAGARVLAVPTPTPTLAPNVKVLWYGLTDWTVPRGTALLLLVIVVGALGAQIHAATSFAVHLGKRDFNNAWNWWYILRPTSGAGLATLLYFVVRGGLLSVAAGPKTSTFSASPPLPAWPACSPRPPWNAFTASLMPPSAVRGKQMRRTRSHRPSIASTHRLSLLVRAIAA